MYINYNTKLIYPKLEAYYANITPKVMPPVAVGDVDLPAKKIGEKRVI